MAWKLHQNQNPTPCQYPTPADPRKVALCPFSHWVRTSILNPGPGTGCVKKIQARGKIKLSPESHFCSPSITEQLWCFMFCPTSHLWKVAATPADGGQPPPPQGSWIFMTRWAVNLYGADSTAGRFSHACFWLLLPFSRGKGHQCFTSGSVSISATSGSAALGR